LGTVDGGTITRTLKPEFETASIAYNANAATIEAAMHAAAAAASIPDFVVGDIGVSSGPLTITPITLTYDGASVAGQNHGQFDINGTQSDWRRPVPFDDDRGPDGSPCLLLSPWARQQAPAQLGRSRRRSIADR
jgi:hypothetical protein